MLICFDCVLPSYNVSVLVSLPHSAMGWSMIVAFSGHTLSILTLCTVKPVLSGHSKR